MGHCTAAFMMDLTFFNVCVENGYGGMTQGCFPIFHPLEINYNNNYHGIGDFEIHINYVR